MKTRYRGLAKGRLDNARYFIRIEWLGEHIVATQVQHLGPQGFVGEWGGNDHAGGLFAGVAKSEELTPVLSGNDDGDVDCIEKRGGLSLIGGLMNGPPISSEHRGKRRTRLLAR